MFLENISFSEAVLFSIVAILVVFLILGLLVLIIKGFSKIKFKEEKPQLAVSPRTVASASLVSIDDDDMMVAALVATIDCVQETKNTNIRVKKIRKLN